MLHRSKGQYIQKKNYITDPSFESTAVTGEQHTTALVLHMRIAIAGKVDHYSCLSQLPNHPGFFFFGIPSFRVRVKWLMQDRTGAPTPPRRRAVRGLIYQHALTAMPSPVAHSIAPVAVALLVLRPAPSGSRGDCQENAGAPRRTGWFSRLA